MSSQLCMVRSDTARGRRRGQAHVALSAGDHLNSICPYIKAWSSLIEENAMYTDQSVYDLAQILLIDCIAICNRDCSYVGFVGKNR